MSVFLVLLLVYANRVKAREGEPKENIYASQRVFDVDFIEMDTTEYFFLAGICIAVGCVTSLLVLFHLFCMRGWIAQRAFDETLLKEDTAESILMAVFGGEGSDLVDKGHQESSKKRKRVYMHPNIVMTGMMFAMMLPMHTAMGFFGHQVLPETMICQMDVAPVIFLHLPAGLVSIFIGLVAIKETNYHASLLHSIFVMYATIYGHLVLSTMAMPQVLCVRTMMNVFMFVMCTWLAFWTPMISGLESLRDKFAYEKALLLLNDIGERERIRML